MDVPLYAAARFGETAKDTAEIKCILARNAQVVNAGRHDGGTYWTDEETDVKDGYINVVNQGMCKRCGKCLTVCLQNAR